MATGNPKRPPRPSGIVTPSPRKSSAEGERELVFDEADVLRADDPRPQHVPQLPVRRAQGRGPQHPQSPAFATEQDRGREHAPAFDKTLTEPSYAPAFLYVERGPGQGQLVPMVEGAVVIGRSSTADFRLQHPSISRRHAQVLRRADRFFVKDFQSQNGTFVNKVRVTREVEIQPGDQIAVGTALIKLRGPNGNVESPSVLSENSGPVRAVVLHSRLFKISVVAGAFGFGLAFVLAVAIVRMSDSAADRPASPVPAPVPTLAAGAKPPVASQPQAPSSTRSSVPPAAVATAPAKPSHHHAGATPVSPVPRVIPNEAAAQPRPAPAPVAVAPAPVAAPAAQKVAAEPSPDLQPIRSKYEGGNVDGALELAKKVHANELIPKLVRFRASYDLAERALATHDAAASKHVQEALRLDEQIAQGWGTYNAELKSQLTSLRSHATARPAETVKTPAARAAADEAWDDGTAAQPPKAPAPAPAKAKKAAIDAAWGD